MPAGEKMEVKLKKKEEVEVEEDSLPADDTPKINREHELELELAEKRGELKALKNNANPTGQMSIEQTKQLVFGDINNLTDEDFQKKYKTSKHAASMTVMDADNRQTKAEAKQLHAEAISTSSLSAKYGTDFYKFKNQILEDVNDLADTAKQDPEKLQRWMERQYLALSKDEGRPIQKKSTDDRRKVVEDFEKPTVEVDGKKEIDNPANDEIKDVVPPDSDISDQRLAHSMGLHSEKERKQYADKNLIYVDMELGDGYHFGDPKRGFERRQKQVA